MKIKTRLAAILALCVAFSMFSGTAFGASARYALVTEAIGDVTVAKAGGALEIPVFAGMTIHEGDRISVGNGGFLKLRTADRGDEIVLGENWRGTLAKLRANGQGGTDTAIKTWAGSMYSQVRKLTDTASSFRAETPAADMHVRGTHFILKIDPKTGLPVLILNAGRVDVSTGENGEEHSAPILPSQQITLYPGADPNIGLEYIDPEDLVISVDELVIAELLKNKQQIDEENEEMLDDLSNPDNETPALMDEEVLQRYRENVENALFHILKAAADAGILPPNVLEEIIETANQVIEETNRRYDLDRDVPPIDRTAGVDPEEEERRRQQREQAEQSKQQRQQQKDERRRELSNQNSNLLDRIQQRNNEQSQANEEAREDRRQEELTEEQRTALEERLRQRREAADQQRDREPMGPPAPTEPPIQNEPDSSSDSDSSDDSDSSNEPPAPISTLTTIMLSESSVVYGQTFTITAEVMTASATAVPDGGIVDFKIGDTVIGSGTIADGKATLTVDGETWQGPALSGIDEGLYTVAAHYAGLPQQYASSVSPGEDLAVIRTSGPVALVRKVIEEENNLVEIHIDLANFTVTNAVYGMELHFRHNLDIYDDLEEYSGQYNADKFDGGHEDDHMFPMLEAYDENLGRQYWIAAYEYLPGNPGQSAEFSALENIAIIRFRLYLDSVISIDEVTIELVHWQFTGGDGETIDVYIHPGAGIIFNQSV